MSIRTRNIHFTNWAKVIEALADKGVTVADESSARTFLTETSSDANPYYYYVGYIKDTQEIYTHGKFYSCSDSSYDDTELRDLIGTKADLSALEALSAEVEENEEVTAAALTELHENKADKSEIPDVSVLATKDELNTLNAEVDNKVDSTTFTTLSETAAGHTTSITNLENNKADKTSLDDYVLKSTYDARVSAVDDVLDLKADKNNYYTKTESDNKYATKESLSDYAKSIDLDTAKTDLNSKINLKQDKLTSGTNIKTVNGNSVLGSGNIETPDTKVTSAANHYGYNSNNATSTTGAFVTKITKDAANHVTSFESRALTSTDIPSLDASKITSGTISIERLPAGALERMFVVASETAAMSATVQEGDVVQVTGNNNKMYFCISNTATTFATKFKEFTAGTATSVAWSGITGKPDLATQEELDVVDAKFDNYFLASNFTKDNIKSTIGISDWALASAKPTYKYSEIEEKPDLSVYALRTAIPTNNNQLTNGAGYITSITGTMVTNALGYTPYNSSNFTKVNIKSTLGISDWALASAAPTIKKERLTNFDSATPWTAFYTSFQASNRPAGANYFSGFTLSNIDFQGEDNTYLIQLALSHTGTLHTRYREHGSFDDWRTLAFTSDIPTKLSQLTDDVVAGKYLPLSGGTISTTATDVLTINQQSNTSTAFIAFRGNGTLCGRFGFNASNNPVVQDLNYGTDYKILLHSGNYSNLLANGTIDGSITAYLLKSITGYTLTSVENESCGLMRNSAITTEGNSADIWLYNTKDIKYRAANHYFTSGNVAIGGTTASEKLHIHGNVKASGSMYAVDFVTTSDNRLKDFVSDIHVDFESLKQIPKKYYYWKDKSMGEELQIGTSAQELAKVYPECVHYDETNDRYSVNYQKLSIVALAAIDKLHDRISELESKLYD